MSVRSPASTIGELDIHLRHAQETLDKLADAVAEMATKQDIVHLTERMNTLATRDELREAEARLEKKSFPSLLDAWLTLILKFGGVIAVVAAAAGSITLFVRFIDKVPK